MLKKLDHYIIKKYLVTLLFIVLIFSIIAVVIDFSDKVEKFIEKDCTKKEIIFDYYMNFIPYINSLLIPLYALIAVIFFTSRMAANSEFLSILNAGIPYRRITRPYMIAAFIVTGIQLIGNHYLIPSANKTRLSFEHAYIWTTNDKMKKRDIHMFISPDTKIYIRLYKKSENYATDFRMESFEDGNLVRYLKASKLKWLGPPNKWQLDNYEVREFNGVKESFVISKGAKKDTTLAIAPKDFIRYKRHMEMLSTPELKEFINQEKSRGLGTSQAFEVEVHQRTSEPVTTIILTLIGLSLASRKIRGGLGLNLALGLAIGATFFFLSKFAETFATNLDLHPAFSVWIPNIVFGFIAIYLYLNAQK